MGNSGYEYSVFYNSNNLTAINVNSGNPNYSSENGVLYNNNKSTLICYPAGKTGSSFTIPNSVNGIGDSAFSNCTSLTSVTFSMGSAIISDNFLVNIFPEGSSGNGGSTLRTAYLSGGGGAGTYTRASGGTTWAKQ